MAFDTGISIADNPIFQAVANHLGVDALMGNSVGSAAGDAVTKAAAPVAPPKPAASPVEGSKMDREFRQHAPLPRATSSRGSSQGGLSPGMSLPGVMSPEVLQHPVVQQLLAQYGVSPEVANQAAETASPNLFVDNPEAFQKHPVLSGMLEHGLEGLAFSRGSNTVGEGLTNVAQSLLNAKAARAEKYNNQLMMPLQQAAQVAQLKGTNLLQEYQMAESKRANAMASYYDQLPEIRRMLVDVQQQRADDQAKNQNRIANLRNQQMAQKTPFNAEELGKLNDMIKKAGGNIDDVDNGAFADLISQASQRKISEDRAAAQKRVETAGQYHVAGARVSASNRSSAADTARLKTTYQELAKQYADFQKQYAAGNAAIDFDGNTVLPYDTAGASKASQRFQERVAAAKTEWEQSDQANKGMTIPGSNMTPATPGRNPLNLRMH